MLTIATMGMRSILLFAILLGARGAFAATGDSVNATNAPTRDGGSLESARALLAEALKNLTNSAAAKAAESPTRSAISATANTHKPEMSNAAPIVATIPQTPLNRDILDDKIRLHPGDIIRFRVQEDKEDTKRLNITDGGEVEIPYLGYVKAEGKTCKELAMDVKRLLEQDYYYLATVNIAVESVLKKSLGRVYVWGRGVSNPGPQDIPQDEPWTVGKAVQRAGPTEFADLKSVRLKKGAAITDKPEAMAASVDKDKKDSGILVNVSDVIRKGKTEKDVPVEPYDVIIVETVLIHFGNQ
jgi:polysaccharide export outer membrane protein